MSELLEPETVAKLAARWEAKNMVKKQYQNIDEISFDLYAMQSYFKNHVGYDEESNLIDEIRRCLNVKEDKRIEEILKRAEN